MFVFATMFATIYSSLIVGLAIYMSAKVYLFANYAKWQTMYFGGEERSYDSRVSSAAAGGSGYREDDSCGSYRSEISTLGVK